MNVDVIDFVSVPFEGTVLDLGDLTGPNERPVDRMAMAEGSILGGREDVFLGEPLLHARCYRDRLAGARFSFLAATLDQDVPKTVLYRYPRRVVLRDGLSDGDLSRK